ncbi:hypothetical protein [Mesorhizobium sp. M1406]
MAAVVQLFIASGFWLSAELAIWIVLEVIFDAMQHRAGGLAG